jgi:phosphate starvation-inducible PhoH-like protein
MEKYKKINGKKLEEIDFNEILNTNNINEVNKIITQKIKVTAKNDSQIKLINSIKNNEITICSGIAGSGKTYVALGMALNLLKKSAGLYKKIYLIKSVTTLKDEEIGFLKGNIDEKIEPFMWSFNINMEKIIGENTYKNLKEKGYVKSYPLAYLRGASLDDCIIILDETQNILLDHSITAMTRIGENCKLIMLGDCDQIDLKVKKDSSLHILTAIFRDTPGIGVIEMDENDPNTRNPLITVIIAKFKEYIKSLKKVQHE